MRREAPAESEGQARRGVGQDGLVLLGRGGAEAVVAVIEEFVVFGLEVEGEAVALALADLGIGDREGEDVPALALGRIEEDEVQGFLLLQIVDELDPAAVAETDVGVVHEDRERAEGAVGARRTDVGRRRRLLRRGRPRGERQGHETQGNDTEDRKLIAVHRPLLPTFIIPDFPPPQGRPWPGMPVRAGSIAPDRQVLRRRHPITRVAGRV